MSIWYSSNVQRTPYAVHVSYIIRAVHCTQHGIGVVHTVYRTTYNVRYTNITLDYAASSDPRLICLFSQLLRNIN